MTDTEKLDIAKSVLIKTLTSLDEQGIKESVDCLAILTFMLAITISCVCEGNKHSLEKKEEMIEDINRIFREYLLKQESK